MPDRDLARTCVNVQLYVVPAPDEACEGWGPVDANGAQVKARRSRLAVRSP